MSPGFSAYIPHRILVNLIDRHVKADIARRRIPDILHNLVVGVSTDGIMPLPVAVQAEKDEIRFRQIQWKGSVCHHIDNKKSNPFGLNNQIPQGLALILPQKGLPAAEKQDAHSHGIQLPHLPMNPGIRMDHRSNVVHRAVLAGQVASVGHDDCAKDRRLFRRRMVWMPNPAKYKKDAIFIRSPSQPFQICNRLYSHFITALVPCPFNA